MQNPGQDTKYSGRERLWVDRYKVGGNFVANLSASELEA